MKLKIIFNHKNEKKGKKLKKFVMDAGYAVVTAVVVVVLKAVTRGNGGRSVEDARDRSAPTTCPPEIS